MSAPTASKFKRNHVYIVVVNKEPEHARARLAQSVQLLALEYFADPSTTTVEIFRPSPVCKPTRWVSRAKYIRPHGYKEIAEYYPVVQLDASTRNRRKHTARPTDWVLVSDNLTVADCQYYRPDPRPTVPTVPGADRPTVLARELIADRAREPYDTQYWSNLTPDAIARASEFKLKEV